MYERPQEADFTDESLATLLEIQESHGYLWLVTLMAGAL